MKIQMNIERLVFEGIDIPAGQRPILQAVIEAELARLLSDRGLNPTFTSDGSLPSLRVQPINYSGNNLVQLGQQIAQSLCSELSTEEEERG